ncbi:MAG: dTMP kinase [Nitrospinae bacterium]|nr:dTMP kinase [Nitrospinota bacterium]
MRGRFITFEGVEGCGKSTQMARLLEWMEKAGLPVLATREPGGTEVGEGIRELLLAPRDEGIDAATELLLYEAARAQHVIEVIRPALEAGAHVLCDRFFDSTTAYQAFGRGLDEEMVLELNRMASGGLVPDLTLLFSVPLEEGLGRARGESAGDRLEGESLAFHRRVQAGFEALAKREPGRFRALGDSAIEQVHEEVLTIVKERFEWAGNPSAARTRP